MALKPNPLTGQLEEDGLPEDPNAIHELAPIDDTTSEVTPGTNPGSGAPALGTDGNPMVATIAASPKPVSEVQTTDRQIVEGDKAKAAATALQGARTAEAGAQDQATEVAGQEANLQAAAAEAKVQELRAKAAQERERAASRDQDRQKWIQGEKSIIAAEVEARRKQTDPEGDFWKGRPVTKVFSNILQALGEIAAGIATPNDPTRKSRVDTALDDLIASHRTKLLKEWESTKEARKLHKENRAEWESEKDRVEVRAANESEAQMRLVEAQLEGHIARLGPQKAAAASELLKRSTAKADAALDLERADKFNKMSEREEVKRTFPAGAAAAPTGSDGTTVKDIPGNVVAKFKNQSDAKPYNDKRGTVLSMTKLLQKLEQQVNDAGKIKGAWPGDVRDGITRTLDDYASQYSVSRGQGANAEAEAKRRIDTLRGSLTGTKESFAEKVRSEIENNEAFYNSHLTNVTPKEWKPPASEAVKPPPPKVGATDLTSRSVPELEAAFKKALSDPDKERAKRRAKAIRAAIDAKKQPVQGQ